jgi:hypothetical protein
MNVQLHRHVSKVAVAAALFGGVAASSTISPAQGAGLGRKVCKTPKYPGKTGRSLSLVTFHLGCTAGGRLSLAQYRCRVAKGHRGICPTSTRILGYKCGEQRLFNRGYYDGKVECTRGNHVSVYIYRQKR